MRKRKFIAELTGGGYFAAYTVVFLCVALLVFSWYLFTGRTLIYSGDGWVQHYRSLVYYAQYLRSIIRNIMVEHHVSIPSWDFSLGEGNDILATLHYYVIGDPFSALSVFVPVRYMHIYYNAMMMMRLYLAGIAFSCLCFQNNIINKYAILAGAMSYVFCFWGIYNAARHPFFLNPMLYLPMVIMGIEKVLRRERPYLLVIAVFLSAISNFYFFYMIVLVTVVYAVTRILCYYHGKLRLSVQMLFRVGILSLAGVLLAAVVLLPVVYVFLNDGRNAGGIKFHFVYPLSYYSKLPALFLSAGSPYWMCMGYAAPVLPAVLLLFRKRGEHRLLKRLFGICVLISLVPALGQVLNGFSYMSNRWSWAFALLSAYILTIMWPSLMKLDWKDSVFLSACTLGYFIVCLMLEYSRTINVFVSIILVFVFLFLLLPVREEDSFFYCRKKQVLAVIVVLISIINNSFWKNSAGGGDYASNGLETWEILENLHSNEASAVADIAASDGEKGFFRYSGRSSITRNVGVSEGISSTQYYWSLSNPYVSEFRKSTQQIENSAYNYRGYDDRAALLALASVRYYVIPAKDSAPVPYGFNYVDTINVKKNVTEEVLEALKDELQVEDLTKEQIKVLTNATQLQYAVYRNDYALPLAYTYDDFISEESWEMLSAVGKQEALLSAVVLNDSDMDAQELVPELENRDLDYTLTCNGSGISIQDNTFIVTSANATVTVSFEGLSDSETYFNIMGLSFQGMPAYDLYFGDETVDPLNLYNKTNWNRLTYTKQEAIRKKKLYWTEPTETKLTLNTADGNSKTLSYYTADGTTFNGRHDFTVNLGYSQSEVDSVTVKFSQIGVYSFDSISVTCQPMGDFGQKINKLKEDPLNNIKTGTDTVSGEITLESPKWICFSIPYSKGWSAYVDGEKRQLYQADIKYMALAVEEGRHDIVLTYQTPLLKEGVLVSGVAAVVFAVYVFFSERKKRLRTDAA